MMGDKRFLRTFKATNLLSFGPESQEIELQALNVLIGPNGAGKSNLIDAISLLQAAPRSLFEPIRAGGGIQEWLWKGSAERHGAIEATVSCSLARPVLRHRVCFRESGAGQTELLEEVIASVPASRGETPLTSYRYDGFNGLIGVGHGNNRHEQSVAVKPNQSILSQRKDPDQYPELTYLGEQYGRIAMFRDWSLGRKAAARRPQQADMIGDFLQEDCANLALVLSNLERNSTLRTILVGKLRDADASIEDYRIIVNGGTVQVHLQYSGLQSLVPATRLSDGTFRYLCLLAILCHPEPPPLVCLEEPELGLHPDLLPGLADLLLEASHRMQLIVTTHSDALVDALTKVPEAILVCEKENNSTRMTRHTREGLAHWLEKYSLGQLWRKGEIGGNRW